MNTLHKFAGRLRRFRFLYRFQRSLLCGFFCDRF